ncbi:MAG: trypsin-like peptidase domain-containing protein [Longimicrobiales bacterium]
MERRRLRFWLVVLAALLPLAAFAARGEEVLRRAFADSPAERTDGPPLAAAANALSTPLSQQVATSPDSLDASRRTAIVAAAERVAPAVVSVNVIRRTTVQPRSIWESFFIPPGYEREVAGLGSGFIVSADGLVVTNEHVVRGATQLVVTLPDGRDLEAELVGTDELNDLALLRMVVPRGGPPLSVAPLGDSRALLIGEWAIAIGNPLGYLMSNTEPTVTAGVISGIGRNIVSGGQAGEGGLYVDMIQTDASINPGNSGGPLVNARGEVIGVNSSIFSRSGGSEGLGFAIPINRTRRIVADLLEDGAVRRAWIGVEVEPSNPNAFGRSGEIVVGSVAPGSPAERARLRVGTTIVRAGERRIRTPLDWDAALLDASVGEPLEVTLREGDRERVVQLVPADLPSLSAERIRAFSDFELITLTPAVRAERQLASERGALIVGLSDQARRSLGLQDGDLIVQINRTRITSAEQAATLLRRLAGGGAVRLMFERRGQLISTWFSIAA